MAESDKMRVKPLDDKSHYTLWKIHVIAAISSKVLGKVFDKRVILFSPH